MGASGSYLCCEGASGSSLCCDDCADERRQWHPADDSVSRRGTWSVQRESSRLHCKEEKGLGPSSLIVGVVPPLRPHSPSHLHWRHRSASPPKPQRSPSPNQHHRHHKHDDPDYHAVHHHVFHNRDASEHQESSRPMDLDRKKQREIDEIRQLVEDDFIPEVVLNKRIADVALETMQQDARHAHASGHSSDWSFGACMSVYLALWPADRIINLTSSRDWGDIRCTCRCPRV